MSVSLPATHVVDVAAPTIRAIGLRKAFGPIVAVDDVSFELGSRGGSTACSARTARARQP